MISFGIDHVTFVLGVDLYFRWREAWVKVVCLSKLHIPDLLSLSYSPACALLKCRPFLTIQALQPLLSKLREHIKCLFIIFVRRPSISMYKPLK